MGKILFVSGSVGLGHIERDLAISREIRRLKPGTEVHWMAGDPAIRVLKANGETVLPESENFDQGTDAIDSVGKDYTANITEVGYEIVGSFDPNGKLIWDIAKRGNYDLVTFDEAFEVATVLYKNPSLQSCKKALLSDYFAFWGNEKGIKLKMVKRAVNNLWLKGIDPKRNVKGESAYVLLCEREDIPNEKIGFLMPNAQDLVGRDFVKFAGYPLPFDPRKMEDGSSLRKQFGLGSEPVILVTVGGTTVGQPLIDLSIKAFPMICKDLPNARMVVVLGPRIKADGMSHPEGVDVKGYVPELYKLMAASDVVISSGGASTTLELMALQKPFLYFPLKGHFEQEMLVAGRNERLGAGTKMQFHQMSPESLAKAVIENFGRKVEPIKADFGGISNAAKEISALL